MGSIDQGQHCLLGPGPSSFRRQINRKAVGRPDPVVHSGAIPRHKLRRTFCLLLITDTAVRHGGGPPVSPCGPRSQEAAPGPQVQGLLSQRQAQGGRCGPERQVSPSHRGPWQGAISREMRWNLKEFALFIVGYQTVHLKAVLMDVDEHPDQTSRALFNPRLFERTLHAHYSIYDAIHFANLCSTCFIFSGAQMRGCHRNRSCTFTLGCRAASARRMRRAPSPLPPRASASRA